MGPLCKTQLIYNLQLGSKCQSMTHNSPRITVHNGHDSLHQRSLDALAQRVQCVHFTPGRDRRPVTHNSCYSLLLTDKVTHTGPTLRLVVAGSMMKSHHGHCAPDHSILYPKPEAPITTARGGCLVSPLSTCRCSQLIWFLQA
jgi:hypothetical protein